MLLDDFSIYTEGAMLGGAQKVYLKCLLNTFMRQEDTSWILYSAWGRKGVTRRFNQLLYHESDQLPQMEPQLRWPIQEKRSIQII